MTVEIIDRKGWKYARIRRPRGQGRSFCQSLGTKDEREAREKIRASNLEQIQLAAQADALTRDVWTRLIAGHNVLVRESITAFAEHRTIIGIRPNSIQKEQCVLDRFVRFVGADFPNKSIGAVEPKHVADFVNQPGGAKLTTRTGWLAHINTWLTYCVDQRWLVKNPAIEVAVRLDGLTQEQLVSNSYVPFTEAEVTRLLAAVPRSDYWHGAILFAYNFGLRLGDVAQLEEGNVVANRLRVFTQKGRKVVDEYMPDDLLAWLADWMKTRPESEWRYIFPEQATAYQVDRTTLSKQFKKILVRVGIKDRVFHSLKKTATNRRWEAELSELGDKDKRALMHLVATNGFRNVQRMLAHSDGSPVTERHYMAKS